MGWRGILFKARVPLGTDSSCNTISSCFAFSVLLAVASSPTPLLSVYRESPYGSFTQGFSGSGVISLGRSSACAASKHRPSAGFGTADADEGSDTGFSA